MEKPIEKLSFKARLITYAVLLLVAAAMAYSDNFAGYSKGLANFSRGFAGGLLLAVVLGEAALYLRRRSHHKNQA
ncbi:hypothetical protein [Pontibacter sp. BAB1700]|uniref:hypothetical protein n=1 Tax=Pontibacter sp. BAB1700 TaxID=1144253 RepID=UPI00026BDA00|nr:hypothetical protein [Pontibacter sp. BAB1700]EJF10034.1 hypothetical protein O71_11729 [Pontibacter sp. BAB1700]